MYYASDRCCRCVATFAPVGSDALLNYTEPFHLICRQPYERESTVDLS